MNENRRERLNDCYDILQELIEKIEDIKNEEVDTFENMTENLQKSEMGVAMQETIEYLGDAVLELEIVKTDIEAIQK